MPRLLPLLVLLAVAGGGASAQDVTPDTLDWHGYFPLAIGNEWEYRVEIVDPADFIDPTDRSRTEYARFRVVGGGAGPEGGRFALVEERFSDDRSSLSRDTSAVQYDSETASVIALRPTTDGEWTYKDPVPFFACDLDLPLGWSGEFDPTDLCWLAAQRPSREEIRAPAVPDSVGVGTAKTLYNSVYGFTSLHGIGFVSGGGGCEPCDSFSSYERWSLTFARVGGSTYGERSVAGEAPPAAARLLRVYPNPAKAALTVEGEGDHVEVYDSLGRRVQVLATPPNAPARLYLGGLAPGVYVVRRGGGATVVTVR